MAAAAIVSLLVIAMDAGAGLLSILAQSSQDQAKHATLFHYFDCKEGSSRAFTEGASAALLLLASHILTVVFTGCLCMILIGSHFQRPGNSLLAFLSTVAFLGGEVLLGMGVVHNHKTRPSCDLGLAKQAFSYSAFACFLHLLFAAPYCFFSSYSSNAVQKPSSGTDYSSAV